jgi:hypothetical protein
MTSVDFIAVFLFPGGLALDADVVSDGTRASL